MAYTYRFKDKYDNTIYVGYTGQTMAQRMNQHFTKGHLPKECYRSVCVIEYIKWKTKSDAKVMEVFFINKYKTKFNKLKKKTDELTIDLGEENWKVYQILKKQVGKVEYKFNWLSYVLVVALIYSVYFLLSR
jgi:excinuclease UvrABC nuclease subunit